MSKINMRTYQRKYHQSHPEMVRESYKRWAENNQEHLKEYRKQYRIKNRERLLAEDRERCSTLEYKENKAEYMRKWMRDTTAELKTQIYQLLGNKCVDPYGIEHGDFLADTRCLQIDHINGNGHEHRRQFHNVYLYFKNILKDIQNGSEDYQLLCANCNWLKRQLNHEVSRHKSNYVDVIVEA